MGSSASFVDVTERSPAEILAELEAQVAETLKEVRGDDADVQKKIAEKRDDLEYLSLVKRFNELGKQHQKWEIVDVTEHGKGFVVLVRGSKSSLHRKAIQHLVEEGTLTDAKVLEIVRDYVKHPSPEEFDALIGETPAVLDVCFQAVSSLWGARAKIRLEK